MTNVQKNEIVEMMSREAENLGSRNKLATMLGISAGSVSQIFNGNWEHIKDDMFLKIAAKVGYSFGGWQVAETSGFKQMMQVFEMAKQKSLFIPVSDKAGAGKSEPAKVYAALNRGNYVYRIQCDEWAKREFLTELCSTLGLTIPNGVISIYNLGQLIINFFGKMAGKNPLLIIDEADKLKAPALRYLIPLFNALEDKLAVVVMGTEHLKKEIKNGVRLNRKGYDEIDSRFGRNYLQLTGATKNDVIKICQANGVAERSLQTEIFKACNPVTKMVDTKEGKATITVIEDLRRVKRVVQRELMKLNTAA